MQDHWLEFGKVALAHLLAVASPGPDFAIVLKQSLSRGRRPAIWTSMGVGTAILVHVTYSLLGLGLLLRSSELWFNVTKYAGAAYIAWLGLQALRAKPRSDVGDLGVGRESSAEGGQAGTPAASPRRAFAVGFFTNALNPKCTLFFISLFVLIVSPHTPKLIQAGYGVYMSVATAVWFCVVSVLFTHREVRSRFLRFGHWIDRALGVVFLGFAISLALATIK
jgi:RhtB (resistance to homoserine/threonine) family protein